MSKQLPILASLLMLLLVAQGLARLTWELMPAQQSSLSPGPVPAIALDSRAATGSQGDTAIQDIARWHLFGEMNQPITPLPVQTRPVDAPETKLNLKLRGVVASNNPDLARAIIAEGRSNGEEKAYAIGDTLPGNAVLREIYDQHVILEYRGRLETLSLPKDELPEGPASPVPSSQRSSTRFGSQASVQQEPSVLLAQYRDALVNDPDSLANLVRFSVVTDGETGETRGYRLSHGRDRSLLGRFQLRSGDVVTEINGISLNDPLKALEVMRSLSTASTINLQVERRGRPLSFSYEIGQ